MHLLYSLLSLHICIYNTYSIYIFYQGDVQESALDLLPHNSPDPSHDLRENGFYLHCWLQI